MTLTHDKVRDALTKSAEWLDEFPHSELAATTRALAEEWLAARTVRWGDSGPFESAVLRGPGFLGVVAFNGEDWGASLDDVNWFVAGAGEAEARAWLEAKAREAGYEIEGGA